MKEKNLRSSTNTWKFSQRIQFYQGSKWSNSFPSSNTTKKSMNTNTITDGKFPSVFWIIFTDWIYFIANFISIYRHNIFVGKYRGIIVGIKEI